MLDLWPRICHPSSVLESSRKLMKVYTHATVTTYNAGNVRVFYSWSRSMISLICVSRSWRDSSTALGGRGPSGTVFVPFRSR